MITLNYTIVCDDQVAANLVRQQISLDALRAIPGVTTVRVGYTVTSDGVEHQIFYV